MQCGPKHGSRGEGGRPTFVFHLIWANVHHWEYLRFLHADLVLPNSQVEESYAGSGLFKRPENVRAGLELQNIRHLNKLLYATH